MTEKWLPIPSRIATSEYTALSFTWHFTASLHSLQRLMIWRFLFLLFSLIPVQMPRHSLTLRVVEFVLKENLECERQCYRLWNWFWKCYQTKPGLLALAVQPIYWHPVVVKQSVAFIERCQTRSPGQLMLKTPELPDGFQASIFKGKVREGNCRVCDQLMHSCLMGWWWGNRVVSQGVTLSVFRHQQVWGLGIPWSSSGYFPPFGRGYSICKITQKMCIRYCYLGSSEEN